MRRGATLLELVLALAVAGLLLGIATPRLAAVRDSMAVDEAARRIAAAHCRARIIAILESRITRLTVRADSIAIRTVGGAADSWRSGGPAAEGVALAGGARQITFSPVGLTMGLSNASFRLSRGTATRTVVVSRLGRVRVMK